MTSEIHPSDRLLTPAQASSIVGRSTKTLANLAERGKLPVIRTVGGHRRYHLFAVLQACGMRIDQLEENPNQLLAPGEAATFVGVDTSTIGKWRRSGMLISCLVEGNHYYRRSDLLKKRST